MEMEAAAAQICRCLYASEPLEQLAKTAGTMPLVTAAGTMSLPARGKNSEATGGTEGFHTLDQHSYPCHERSSVVIAETAGSWDLG